MPKVLAWTISLNFEDGSSKDVLIENIPDDVAKIVDKLIEQDYEVSWKD